MTEYRRVHIKWEERYCPIRDMRDQDKLHRAEIRGSDELLRRLELHHKGQRQPEKEAAE